MKTILSSGHFSKATGQTDSQSNLGCSLGRSSGAGCLYNLEFGSILFYSFFLTVHLPIFSGTTDSERERNKCRRVNYHSLKIQFS